MLICALAVTASIFVYKAGDNLWLAVTLISIAAAAHQGWSANIFNLPSDVFPQRAVASVVGLGGMGGAVGGLLASPAIGYWLRLVGRGVRSFVRVRGLALSGSFGDYSTIGSGSRKGALIAAMALHHRRFSSEQSRGAAALSHLRGARTDSRLSLPSSAARDRGEPPVPQPHRNLAGWRSLQMARRCAPMGWTSAIAPAMPIRLKNSWRGRGRSRLLCAIRCITGRTWS